jgi:hypothetical protein
MMDAVDVELLELAGKLEQKIRLLREDLEDLLPSAPMREAKEERLAEMEKCYAEILHEVDAANGQCLLLGSEEDEA